MDLLPFKKLLPNPRNIPQRWVRNCFFVLRSKDAVTGKKIYTPIYIDQDFNRGGYILNEDGTSIEAYLGHVSVSDVMVPNISAGLISSALYPTSLAYLNRRGGIDYGRGVPLSQISVRGISFMQNKLRVTARLDDNIVTILRFIQSALARDDDKVIQDGVAHVIQDVWGLIPDVGPTFYLTFLDSHVGVWDTTKDKAPVLFPEYQQLTGVMHKCFQKVQTLPLESG